MDQLIVITSPNSVAAEAAIINELFACGLQLLHLRKPDFSVDELIRFIATIKQQYHKLIVLPANVFGQINGVQKITCNVHFFEHLRMENEANYFAELKAQGGQLSTSIHDAASYRTLPDAFDYTFFSPVFDSISKAGYKAMNRDQLSVLKEQRKSKIIALGGVDEHNCRQAIDYGFDGVAVLGAVWQNSNPVSAFKKINSCIIKGQ